MNISRMLFFLSVLFINIYISAMEMKNQEKAKDENSTYLHTLPLDIKKILLSLLGDNFDESVANIKEVLTLLGHIDDPRLSGQVVLMLNEKYGKEIAEVIATFETPGVQKWVDLLAALTNGIKENNVKKVEEALEAGADPNVTIFSGESPLLRAINSYKNPKIIELLLRKGANPNSMSSLNFTPLTIVSGDKELVKLLLDYKADPNLQSQNPGFKGWTPLHFAVYFDSPEVEKLLIDAGADKAIKNADDKNASEIEKV